MKKLRIEIEKFKKPEVQISRTQGNIFLSKRKMKGGKL
jgi:hypothetical protein